MSNGNVSYGSKEKKVERVEEKNKVLGRCGAIDASNETQMKMLKLREQ